MKTVDKILVIDDSITTQNLIRKILDRSENQVEIISAMDGKEGLRSLISNQDISLLLIDITMPKLNGVDALKLINEHFPNRKFKICMISGRNTSSDIKECVKNGCDDYIIKPFDIERFRTKINYFLGNEEKKEISTTYVKDISIKATVLDIPLKAEVLLTSLSEYNIYFESKSDIHTNAVLKLKIKDEQLYFTQTGTIDILVNEVTQINSQKYSCTGRIINVSEQEENDIRAYVIGNIKKESV